MMNTLEDYLRRNAEQYPDKPAVMELDGRSLTYGELYRLSAERAAAIGSKEGCAVTLRASQTADFLINYFAIHMAHGVVVPLPSDMPDEAVRAIEDELASVCFPPSAAEVLYTTGTTGSQKGVEISHRVLLADADNLSGRMPFSSETVFINVGPMNHIGSLSKLYPVITNAAALLLIDGMKYQNAFFRALEYPSNHLATFLVPASIRILLAFGHERLAQYADKLEFLETGAAPISHADMLRLCSILPRTKLFNTYASTETGIISSYDYNDGRCQEMCLGTAMRNSSFRITERGTIACSGATLMSGYVRNAALTASVLHDGTLFTADRGTIDSEGMLHLLGREDDVINSGGFKINPSEVEDAALALRGVADCVCIGIPHPILGTALKLLVVMDEGAEYSPKDIARGLSARLETHKVPLKYEQVGEVKRTFNGKIDRKYYRQ